MNWVNCNDQLPEEGTIVVVKNARAWSIAFLDEEGNWNFEFLTISDPITHWLNPQL